MQSVKRDTLCSSIKILVLLLEDKQQVEVWAVLFCVSVTQKEQYLLNVVISVMFLFI